MQKPFWTKTWLMIAIALVALAVAATPVLAVDVPPDAKNAAPAAPAGDNQVQAPTLLENWFGVNLSIYNYSSSWYAFNQSSFTPTKRGLTVDWIEDDWFSAGSTSSPGLWGQYPSSGELYDVEAIYFDNDMNNIYITIVTSFPFSGLQYDSNTWVAPGDLSLNLGINDPRSTADPWSYDFGVNLVNETRPPAGTDIPAPPSPHNLGNLLYKTANSEWYPGTPTVAVAAGNEHTNFSPSAGNTALGAVTVAYEPVVFANNENGQGTYAIAVTIPRSLLSYAGHPNGPVHGETVGIRWTPSCRNDGNNNDPVILLVGDIEDIDTGDAPDSSNHPGAAMTYDGLPGSVGGFFPTVADPSVAGTTGKTGMCHYIKPTGAFLGASVSAEADADLQPDPDTNPAAFNLFPAANTADGDSDDGLKLPNSWENQVETSFIYTVTLPTDATAGDRYVNVWFDWNRDGDWEDAAVVCDTARATAAEHVLQNQVVSVTPGASQTFTSNVMPCNNPEFFNNKTAVWVRITLSNEPINLTTQFDGSGRAAGATYEYCYAEGETEDWYFLPKDPTAVDLARFEAAAQAEGILLEWETASELDNLGFNLYRSTELNGDYIQLNAALIPAQNPGAVFGGIYTWVDEDVTPGVTYFYKLEDVDIYGVTTLHGPVQATALAAGPSAVRIASFSAGGAGWTLPAALSALALLSLKRRRK
ncbi:MAG: GEVED domain-containing protein [Anaerolineae bacterium]|jgi:hypothetical protein|nr:GEVED domain-containing protein [Anaerolineae bacterium]